MEVFVGCWRAERRYGSVYVDDALLVFEASFVIDYRCLYYRIV